MKKPADMTDDELLHRLSDIARARGWKVEDVQAFDDQAEAVLTEMKRRGLKPGRGTDGQKEGNTG